MRVVVIGGHGRTGILIVQALLKAGHQVVATIRNPRHMVDLVKLGAETVMMELETSPLELIMHSMEGAEAVVFAAGSAEGEGSALDRKGTLRTVRAAEKAGVRRYLSVSAIGASTGLSIRGMSAEMQDYYKQKRAAARHITTSSLEWTILEPAELIDEKGSGKVTASLQALDGEPIARADVAAVVVAVLEDAKAVGKAIQLGGGTARVETALKRALG